MVDRVLHLVQSQLMSVVDVVDELLVSLLVTGQLSVEMATLGS